MTVNRALSLVLLLFISASLQGCILGNIVHGVAITLADAITGSTLRLDSIEPRFNTWLGKTKDARMKGIRPPDRCAPLSAGGEVCEWVSRGVSASGGDAHSWEDHIVYTYDRDGIAIEWNYNGSLGQRSSRDSQALKEAGPCVSQSGVSQAKTGIQEKASSARQSPSEIALVGFHLEAGASRQQIEEAILSRGGKLLSHLHSPERDEFDSSRWIDGSEKAGAIYTKTGQFVGLVISWSVADSQRGRTFATQLQAKLTKDFGPTTRDHIGQGGWPLSHEWETTPVSAVIIAEGKDSPNVLAMFVFQERLAVFNSELGNKGKAY